MTAFFDEVKGVTIVEAISNEGAEQRKFENGCFLSVNSDGWVTGTNPYGWDDLFLGAAEPDSVGRVQRWLAFWSEPRDERGQLIADHETRLRMQNGGADAGSACISCVRHESVTTVEERDGVAAIDVVTEHEQQADEAMPLGGEDESAVILPAQEELSSADTIKGDRKSTTAHEQHRPTVSVVASNELHRLPMSALGLGESTAALLRLEGVVYVGDLVQKDEVELRKVPKIGHVRLDAIKEALAHLGLSLGVRLDNWPPSAEEC